MKREGAPKFLRTAELEETYRTVVNQWHRETNLSSFTSEKVEKAGYGQIIERIVEARDERRLLKLLIIDELGFVPLSRTGAELLFEVFSQHYDRGSILVNTNLPFDEWTEVFGSERLTHHFHILGMNGETYLLKRSRETAPSQP